MSATPLRVPFVGTSFFIGVAPVLAVPQPLVGLLHFSGVVPFAPFSTTPTRPLGMPQFASLAFWGGIWMIPILGLLEMLGTRGFRYWVAAFLLGGLPPSMLTWLVIYPIRGLPMGMFPILTAIFINGVWGMGSAAIWFALRRRITGLTP